MNSRFVISAAVRFALGCFVHVLSRKIEVVAILDIGFVLACENRGDRYLRHLKTHFLDVQPSSRPASRTHVKSPHQQTLIGCGILCSCEPRMSCSSSTNLLVCPARTPARCISRIEQGCQGKFHPTQESLHKHHERLPRDPVDPSRWQQRSAKAIAGVLQKGRGYKASLPAANILDARNLAGEDSRARRSLRHGSLGRPWHAVGGARGARASIAAFEQLRCKHVALGKGVAQPWYMACVAARPLHPTIFGRVQAHPGHGCCLPAALPPDMVGETTAHEEPGGRQRKGQTDARPRSEDWSHTHLLHGGPAHAGGIRRRPHARTTTPPSALTACHGWQGSGPTPKA
jgi:hypothetical protein